MNDTAAMDNAPFEFPDVDGSDDFTLGNLLQWRNEWAQEHEALKADNARLLKDNAFLEKEYRVLCARLLGMVKENNVPDTSGDVADWIERYLVRLRAALEAIANLEIYYFPLSGDIKHERDAFATWQDLALTIAREALEASADEPT